MTLHVRKQDDAIIKIASGDKPGEANDYKKPNTGTAFLIDSSRGIFMTARHVVTPSIGASPRPLTGNNRRGAEFLQLSVVADHEEMDIALLKVASDQVDRVQNRAELELMFLTPESDDVVILTMAYSTMDSPDVSRKPGADFSVNNGKLRVVQDTTDGTSGAPVVIKSSGMVIGVVVHDVRTDIAVAQPVENMVDFLIYQTKDVVPDALREMVEDPASRRLELHEVFRTDSRNPFTNLQLAGFVHSIYNRWRVSPNFDFPKHIGNCRVANIAIHRGLGFFAGYLHSVAHEQSGADSIGIAAALEEDAQEEEAASQSENARALFTAAVREYSEPLMKLLILSSLASWSNGSGDDAGSILRLAAQDFALNTNKLNTKKLKFLVPTEPSLRNDSARRLLEYHAARVAAARLSPSGYTVDLARHLFIASAIGTQLAVDPRTSGRHYEAMGDALSRLGMHREAAAAYRTALAKLRFDKELVKKLKNASRAAPGPRNLRTMDIAEIWRVIARIGVVEPGS